MLAAELGVEPMDETSALYRGLCAPSGRVAVATPSRPMAMASAAPAPGNGDLREVLVATRDQMRTAIGLIDSALAQP